jgi:hypothetical protein
VKLLSIRIPIAPAAAIVREEHEQAAKRAALNELYRLIPGLSKLKKTIPGLGTQAIGSQLWLTVMLVPTGQLELNLGDASRSLAQVVELDPAVVDQIAVKKSLQLTQDLLADAGHGLPEALKEWLDRLRRSDQGRAANRLRRELGRRYEISVFEQPEILSLPEIEPTRLEEGRRSISLIVNKMKGRQTFWADHLQEVRDDDHPPMIFDPRQLLVFRRLGESTTFAAGTRLHESMETGVRVVARGRFVTHIHLGTIIAMEVEAVDPVGCDLSAAGDFGQEESGCAGGIVAVVTAPGCC